MAARGRADEGTEPGSVSGPQRHIVVFPSPN